MGGGGEGHRLPRLSFLGEGMGLQCQPPRNGGEGGISFHGELFLGEGMG